MLVLLHHLLSWPSTLPLLLAIAPPQVETRKLFSGAALDARACSPGDLLALGCWLVGATYGGLVCWYALEFSTTRSAMCGMGLVQLLISLLQTLTYTQKARLNAAKAQLSILLASSLTFLYCHGDANGLIYGQDANKRYVESRGAWVC